MKKTIFKKLVLLTASIFLFTACNKDDEPSGSSAQVDVYVGGYEKGPDTKNVAKIWKNGVGTNLSDGTKDNIVKEIMVSGNDVYAIGTEVRTISPGVTKNFAKLWKNDTEIPLGIDNTNESQAQSVFVDGSDVYVLFRSDNKTFFWKNGVVTQVSNNINYMQAEKLLVKNNDVYVAGYIYTSMVPSGNAKAFIWKNGQITELSDGTRNTLVTGAAISGNDVYVVGYSRYTNDNRMAKLWKNGQEIDITDGGKDTYTTDMFVSGNDVYITGKVRGTNGYHATVWKNGVPTTLSGNYSQASSVFVYGQNVYVAGSNFSSIYTGIIWKNGVEESVIGGDFSTDLYSICVVPKR